MSINKAEILNLRNYLLSRFLYKYKILNIFLIIFYSGLIMLFITSLILFLNYKYNEKTLDTENLKIFLILLIIASVLLFLMSFFVTHAIIFLVVTNFVIIRTNNYKYTKEIKKINYFSFAYVFFFYNKKENIKQIKSSDFYSSLLDCKQLGDFYGNN